MICRYCRRVITTRTFNGIWRLRDGDHSAVCYYSPTSYHAV